MWPPSVCCLLLNFEPTSIYLLGIMEKMSGQQVSYDLGWSCVNAMQFRIGARQRVDVYVTHQSKAQITFTVIQLVSNCGIQHYEDLMSVRTTLAKRHTLRNFHRNMNRK